MQLSSGSPSGRSLEHFCLPAHLERFSSPFHNSARARATQLNTVFLRNPAHTAPSSARAAHRARFAPFRVVQARFLFDRAALFNTLNLPARLRLNRRFHKAE